MAWVADLVNPLLAFCLLAASARARRPWPLLRALLALGFVYGLAGLDAWFGWWGEWHLDYSTHAAFFLATAGGLAALDRRWLWTLLPMLVGYTALMVALRYHSLADVAATLAVVFPVTWACQRLHKTIGEVAQGTAASRGVATRAPAPTGRD